MNWIPCATNSLQGLWIPSSPFILAPSSVQRDPCRNSAYTVLVKAVTMSSLFLKANSLSLMSNLSPEVPAHKWFEPGEESEGGVKWWNGKSPKGKSEFLQRSSTVASVLRSWRVYRLHSASFWDNLSTSCQDTPSNHIQPFLKTDTWQVLGQMRIKNGLRRSWHITLCLLVFLNLSENYFCLTHFFA